MLRRTWAVVRLIVLYLECWIVGLDEEGFQVAKGNCLADLRLYSAAAHAYSRALRGSKSPLIHAQLGWCYLNAGMPDRAIASLTLAYARTARHDIGMTLVQAHVQAGNVTEGSRLLTVLKQAVPEGSTQIRASPSSRGKSRRLPQNLEQLRDMCMTSRGTPNYGPQRKKLRGLRYDTWVRCDGPPGCS
jgi:tetratricopeptide (TPR) repeat protein